jgi:hypothetical protein
MTTSLSNSKRYESSDGQPGSVVWFISFGDLLTLLLCFFLVLTPWDRLKKPENPELSSAVIPASIDPAIAGTTFASDLPLRGSVIKLELPLFEGVGGSSGEGLSSAALSEELKRAWSGDDRVEVLVCSDIDERATVVRYVGEAFERSFRSSATVRFVVARTCDGSRVLAPVTRKTVARIRIVGT